MKTEQQTIMNLIKELETNSGYSYKDSRDLFNRAAKMIQKLFDEQNPPYKLQHLPNEWETKFMTNSDLA